MENKKALDDHRKDVAIKNLRGAQALAQALQEPGFPYLSINGGYWSDVEEDILLEAIVEVHFGNQFYYASFDDDFLMMQAYGENGLDFTYIFGKDGEKDYGWEDLEKSIQTTKDWIRERVHLDKPAYTIRHVLGLSKWPEQG